MLRVYFKHFFLATFLLFFLWPQSIFATNPPNLISPADNSTVEKPKLSWEFNGSCIESGSCFRIEVDNNSDFSSTEKSTYTNNYSYSPQGLTEGTWYWRAKAKDKSEKWSNFSQSKFIIGTSTISSASTSPAPSQESSSKKSQSVFEVKNISTEINSEQEFESQITLIIPDSPNQTFYLKGAFKKEGDSNYFGQTFAEGWVKNSEKYAKQLKISTASNGSWEGKIKIKPDSDDSGFDGTGDYIFKVGRYSDSGSGPTWSNELRIKINAVEKPSPSPEEPEEEIVEEEEEPDLTASLVKESPRSFEIKIASVAGESTTSNNTTSQSETKVLGEKSVNWLLISLGIGVLATGSGFVLYKFKKEKLHANSFN